jgi:hypothetical protein
MRLSLDTITIARQANGFLTGDGQLPDVELSIQRTVREGHLSIDQARICVVDLARRAPAFINQMVPRRVFNVVVIWSSSQSPSY